MRKILLIGFLILSVISCKAQSIIPVEQAIDYIDSDKGLMGDNTYVYVKDVNGLLNKFVSTWKGVHNNKNYEFRIVEITTDDGELKEDKLLIRYKITEPNGTVLENTLTLPSNSPYVIKGSYLTKHGSYVLYYQGKQHKCGQNGDVFIGVYGVNDTKLQLFLSVDGDMMGDCPNGAALQILPTDQIELIKQ